MQKQTREEIAEDCANLKKKYKEKNWNYFYGQTEDFHAFHTPTALNYTMP